MNAVDFEYDGRNLSDIGFTVCRFDSDDLQTITSGSQITFNTVPTLRGAKHELLSTSYDTCLEATFQICRDPCVYDNIEISLNELRYIMSWLNRKSFHKFKLLTEGYLDLYFEASFNVSKIEFQGKIYGLELDVRTNRPFALHEPVSVTLRNTEANGKKFITDLSEEEGFIYPHMEIEILEGGDLSIYNDLDKKTMVIKNCVSEEKITLDYPIISSSLPSHKIQNDFNWDFFRIVNTFRTKRNNLTVSLPCNITIKYSPIIKLGI